MTRIKVPPGLIHRLPNQLGSPEMAAETFDRKAEPETCKKAKSSKGKRKWCFGIKDKNWPFAFGGNPNADRIDLWPGNPDREDD